MKLTLKTTEPNKYLCNKWNLINILAFVIGIPLISLVNIRNIEGKGKVLPKAIETIIKSIQETILLAHWFFSSPRVKPVFFSLLFGTNYCGEI